MVGLWFLVPTIGVRVPDRQLDKKDSTCCHKVTLWSYIYLLFCVLDVRDRDEKSGAM